MTASALAQLQGETYISLETFERSGEAVATPVWFCIDQGVIYVNAPGHTGKVKRLCNNPNVRLAACNATGKVYGAWMQGRARFAQSAEFQHADRLLKRKYHVQRMMIDLVGKLRGWRSVMLAIEVDSETESR